MEIEVLKRRLAREIAARKEAETILEKKALELFRSNEQLQLLNQSQENIIAERTKELLESKKQFQSLVESAGDIIYNADVKGYFTYVNPVTSSLLGYTKSELIGKHYSDLVRQDKIDEVKQFYLEVLEKKIETSYLEFPVCAKDGSVFWLGQRVHISFNEIGEIKVTAVARDITELVNARKALEESEKRYRSIINNMELGLLEVDNNGLIVKAYDWFCDMTGYTAEELIGKDPIEIFVHKDDVSTILEQEKNRSRGQAGVYELRMKKKNGEDIWVAISGAPFYNINGEVTGSMGIHLDITPQKKLQQELQEAKDAAVKAQKAEKDFLAHMSHEIRTPLNAVLGMANLLTDTPLNKLQESYVQDIRYAADALHGLISDVLDISKIEAGEIDVVESEVDLYLVISMLCKTLDFRTKEKGNKLVYYIDEDVPGNIFADKNFLNQILYNLVYNALKFTKDGKVSISVHVSNKATDYLLLEFKVTDTGIGIHKDKLTHVFERYKQETKDTQHKYGGTGLGLAICKKLVELHGGEISAESEEGKGSVFTFTIKAKEAPVRSESSDSLIKKERNLSFLNILIAEDNELNLKYIGTILDQWNVKYSVAKNGTDAIALSEKEKFDVILMDMQMPVMDGYDAAIHIRSDKNNLNNKTIILALTASALLDEKRRAREAGMNDHLTKPFTPDGLYSFISRHVEDIKQEYDANNSNIFSTLTLPESIDAAALSDFYIDDIEYAHNIVTFYLERAYDEITSGQKLLQDNKKEELTKWIHRMAPNFVMVGLPDYTQKFRALESDLKNADDLNDYRDIISTLLQSLIANLKDVEELKNVLHNKHV